MTFDPSSTLLHCDEHGLPIHGVKWALLAWDVIDASSDRLAAKLDWMLPELLSVFPFRHQVEMTATIRPDSLTIETTVMGDDIGWMQPSIYHRGLMVGETPNIDRIGREGAIFMDYVAMSLSPTEAC